MDNLFEDVMQRAAAKLGDNGITQAEFEHIQRTMDRSLIQSRTPRTRSSANADVSLFDMLSPAPVEEEDEAFPEVTDYCAEMKDMGDFDDD